MRVYRRTTFNNSVHEDPYHLTPRSNSSPRCRFNSLGNFSELSAQRRRPFVRFQLGLTPLLFVHSSIEAAHFTWIDLMSFRSRIMNTNHETNHEKEKFDNANLTQTNTCAAGAFRADCDVG